MSFDGWSISEAMFNHIRKILPEGKTILELGSGWGTSQLVKHYTVYSVEHNEKFLNLYNSNYLHVPLKNHKEVANHIGDEWYDAVKLREALKGIVYDLLLIDGPPRYRAGFVKYFDIFDANVIMMFDDLQRNKDRLVCHSTAGRLRKPYITYGVGGGKPFGVINDPCTR